MAQLDDQLAALQAVLSQLEDDMRADLATTFGGLSAADDQELINQLAEEWPTVAQQYNAAAAQVTAQWYDELAPDAPYKAEVPDLDTLLPSEKVIKSISWAINTSNTIEAAQQLLAKSTQRMVYDGSRDTVVHNAKKEKVKYVRHANYAGVCNWCLVMATKGAVYTSAAAAVAGHDNCKCFAVPIRQGVHYEPPAEVKAAAVKYEKAVKTLKAEGKQPSLDNIIAEMDKADAAAVQAAKPPASEYAKLPPAQKKTVQNSYQGKKNKAKAKFGEASTEYQSLKAMGSDGYYELVYKPEHGLQQAAAAAKAETAQVTDQAKWLAAEAKHNAEQAITKAAEIEAKATAATTAKADAHKAAKEHEVEALADWEQALLADVVPPPAIPEPATPDFGSFTMQGSAGGSHGAVFMTDANGTKYLVKPQKHYKNLLDETTAHLQHKTGLPAPNVWTTKDIPGIAEASVQEFLPGGNAYSPSIIGANNLKGKDLEELQKNQVFDWLIANHDTHAQQWVRDKDGHLVGVDKGQAFKWLGKDKLDWEFHPNKQTGEHEPIYNTIWKLGNDGKVTLLDPHGENALHAYIQGVQGIPDAEFKEMLRPFAEAAASNGKLLAATDGFDLLPKYPVASNDVEGFLNLAVARKNNLQNDFDALYSKHIAAKTGFATPTAPPISVPQPPLSVDIDLAAKAKAEWSVANLIDAHKAAKLGNYATADTKIAQVQVIQGMTTEEWAASPASSGLIGTSSKQAVSPAAKALKEHQAATYKELLDLVDQGAVTAQTLAQPGHIAGVAAKKADDAFQMSPLTFSQKFPEKVGGFANPVAPDAVKPSDYFKLPPAQKKTVQNSYSGKKNKAKAKFGANSPEYLELKAMGPDGYYAKVYAANKPAAQAVAPKVEPTPAATPAAPAGPKQIDPTTDNLTTAAASLLDADYQKLTKEQLYKVGNQFSGKKNKAKKGTTPEAKHLNWLYSQWSKKDFYAAQQLTPGTGSLYKHPYLNYDANQFVDMQAAEYKQAKALHDEWVSTHPTLSASDSPYWGAEHLLKWQNAGEYKQWLIDHGQTTMLGSPLGGTPKVPGAKANIEPPVKNPPNDPAKIQQIADWQAQYLAAKPGGTGFNPIKSYDPSGTLKTNIEGFAQDYGVGYLTDDQLYQVLVKLPATQKTKYLKQYADAKGQKAADAIAAKVNPAGGPSVVSPPTSAGSKPAGYGATGADFWKSQVQMAPGKDHTPVRKQAPSHIVKALDPTGKVVKDASAPLGSADNPHIFSHEDNNDYKIFGALHTDQNENNWVSAQLSPLKSYTSSGYIGFNTQLREELQALLDSWIDESTGKPKIDPISKKPIPKPKPGAKAQKIDAAFDAAVAKQTEDWIVLTRGTSRREFNDNTVPGLGPFTTGGKSGTVAELKALEGHEFTQHGFGSTSLSDSPAFSYKHIRVIYRIPPGSKMLYVDGTPNGGWGSAISNNAGEREVLLPRDSRYKVLEVRDSSSPYSAIDVVVELVEQEPLG